MCLMTVDEKLEAARTLRRLPEPYLRRTLRVAAGIAQVDVAEHCGVSRETVARWENGTRTPSGDRLLRYSRLMNRLAEEVAR